VVDQDSCPQPGFLFLRRHGAALRDECCASVGQDACAEVDHAGLRVGATPSTPDVAQGDSDASMRGVQPLPQQSRRAHRVLKFNRRRSGPFLQRQGLKEVCRGPGGRGSVAAGLAAGHTGLAGGHGALAAGCATLASARTAVRGFFFWGWRAAVLARGKRVHHYLLDKGGGGGACGGGTRDRGFGNRRTLLLLRHPFRGARAGGLVGRVASQSASGHGVLKGFVWEGEMSCCLKKN